MKRCGVATMRNKRLIILISILSFITVLIVFSSVLFSVQGVYASCYNTDDAEFDLRVAATDVSGIKKGKSIFLLKEKDVIRSVESELNDVRVINVERKFPNRVYINYVKIYSYFAVESENDVAYVSNDGKILSVGEKQSAYADHMRYVGGSVTALDEGAAVFADGSEELSVFDTIIAALERVGKHSTIIQTIEEINTEYTLKTGLTYFKTRTGTCFELQGGKSNMLDKLRLALSVYSSDETTYMNGGTIIINSSATRANHTADNRYPLDSGQV